MSSFEMNN